MSIRADKTVCLDREDVEKHQVHKRRNRIFLSNVK
jgi:hypothetical protein